MLYLIRTCIGGVADGLVFIFVAGTCYLLAILIAGLKKFTWKILLDLFYCLSLVSWAVWSHRLLTEQAQPYILKN
jgi:cytochrome c oxidase subunit 1